MYIRCQVCGTRLRRGQKCKKHPKGGINVFSRSDQNMPEGGFGNHIRISDKIFDRFFSVPKEA